jgi:NAD(P)-dependent dehydrogenase (short-subunit alcohol dehydrogenase family)
MNGKKVLITGGAGHIGRALAGAFLRAGASVVLVDRDFESLESIKVQLEKETGSQPETIAVDLVEDSAAEMVREALKDWECLDVLIHAAAFVGTTNLEGWVVPFEEQTVATWEVAMKVNLTSVFVMTQALYQQLLKSKSPSVVNISSIYGIIAPDYDLYEGIQGMGNPAAYAASKGGLNQLTRWMSSTLAPNVRVNALNLGGIFRGQDPRFVERYCKKVPLGRMGTEEDIVGPVMFLAGDDSQYVTGQTLSVDGGYTTL